LDQSSDVEVVLAKALAEAAAVGRYDAVLRLARRLDPLCVFTDWREPVRMADKHHVTGKPTAVMQRLVRICTPDGVVLDPFAGSGTTGVAALLEGRTFLGVEVAGEYARIASDRLRATGSQVQLADYRAGQQPLFPRSQVVGQ
jgi:hypothetical protein